MGTDSLKVQRTQAVVAERPICLQFSAENVGHLHVPPLAQTDWSPFSQVPLPGARSKCARTAALSLWLMATNHDSAACFGGRYNTATETLASPGLGEADPAAFEPAEEPHPAAALAPTINAATADTLRVVLTG